MTEMVSGEPPFVGPKYPHVEESHKYGPVPQRHGPGPNVIKLFTDVIYEFS
jgi:hypothetical protein